MTTDWRVPIRRSPLEHAHVAMGAAWIADDIRWPQTYGDVSGESTAAIELAALADIGPIDHLVIRGRYTAAALTAIDIEAEPRTVVAGPDATEAWCLADDEAFVLLPGSSAPGPGSATGGLIDRIRATGATVTDLSSGTTVLRLVGPASPSILAEACAVDVSPAAIDEGAIVQAPMAGVRVSLVRRDQAGLPGSTILVARDQAEYLWDSLLMLGAPHGLVPVGASALLGAP